MNPVNIDQKLSLFDDVWSPKLLAELNGQHVKLAKLLGEFVWHSHENEDELFYVLDGELTMEFRDRTEIVRKNEFIVIPRGIEHRPVAHQLVSVLLFEPASTLNTGNVINEMTVPELERI